MKKIIKVATVVLLATVFVLVILNIFTTRSLKSEILIDAPSDEVWNVLMNHEAYPAWNPFIIKISGSTKTGDFLKTTLQTEGNDPMDFKPIVLKNQFRQEFRWKGKLGIKGIFDGEHYFILEEVTPNQTRFIQGENFTGLFSGLLMKMIGEDTKEGFISMNKALKTRVEGQQK
ncbi:MAG: SRPBCC domain-containing protein [Melioribacteraceae bacterium]|nr:SRPBCC domain-containing protein [Melioribacteraceae bacterium]MCF8265986.1 SRPBCC domain-containing protein [Melioribacteraceae bacterium]MCF8430794.1 SRPBCC domain-containing protein [Melioribacteraceae bacterium]